MNTTFETCLRKFIITIQISLCKAIPFYKKIESWNQQFFFNVTNKQQSGQRSCRGTLSSCNLPYFVPDNIPPIIWHKRSRFYGKSHFIFYFQRRDAAFFLVRPSVPDACHGGFINIFFYVVVAAVSNLLAPRVYR